MDVPRIVAKELTTRPVGSEPLSERAPQFLIDPAAVGGRGSTPGLDRLDQ